MKDFLLDETNDLKITNGDFEIGSSDQQEIESLMMSHKGEWKEHPLAGAGLEEYLKSRKLTKAVREAKKQLQEDGFEVFDVEFEGSNILIDAQRDE